MTFCLNHQILFLMVEIITVLLLFCRKWDADVRMCQLNLENNVKMISCWSVVMWPLTRSPPVHYKMLLAKYEIHKVDFFLHSVNLWYVLFCLRKTSLAIQRKLKNKLLCSIIVSISYSLNICLFTSSESHTYFFTLRYSVQW